MCEFGSDFEGRLKKTARVEIQNVLLFKRAVSIRRRSVGRSVRLCGVLDSLTGMEHHWDDTDGGKRKDLNQDPPQCHYVHHICHMIWPGMEPVPPR